MLRLHLSLFPSCSRIVAGCWVIRPRPLLLWPGLGLILDYDELRSNYYGTTGSDLCRYLVVNILILIVEVKSWN